MTILNTLRSRLDQRNRYLRTLAELNSLSEAEAHDLGLSRTEFPRLAHEAVYGR